MLHSPTWESLGHLCVFPSQSFIVFRGSTVKDFNRAKLYIIFIYLLFVNLEISVICLDHLEIEVNVKKKKSTIQYSTKISN